jgi:hypothetical protein
MHGGHKIRQASSCCTSAEFIHPFWIHPTVCQNIKTFCTPLLIYFSSMDFIDDPAQPILTAVFEIPGIKTNDISLHILNGHLVVSGERRPPYNTTQQSEGSHQNTAENGIQAPKQTIPIHELRFGVFRRAIRVPEGLKVRVPLHLHSQSSTYTSASFPPNQLASNWLDDFYRSQTSKLASAKVCWQSHGQGYLLQPYALRALLLQVLPDSNPPNLLASSKKYQFGTCLIPTQSFHIIQVYLLECTLGLWWFLYMFSFFFFTVTYAFFLLSNPFVTTHGTEFKSKIVPLQDSWSIRQMWTRGLVE